MDSYRYLGIAMVDLLAQNVPSLLHDSHLSINLLLALLLWRYPNLLHVLPCPSHENLPQSWDCILPRPYGIS
jgi:hypothetical protein